MFGKKILKYSAITLLFLSSNTAYANMPHQNTMYSYEDKCSDDIEWGKGQHLIKSIKEAQEFISQNGVLKNTRLKLSLKDSISLYIYGINNNWNTSNLSTIKEYLLYLSSIVVNMDSQMLSDIISNGSKQEMINLHSYIGDHKQYYHASCLPKPEQEKIKVETISKMDNMSISQLLQEYKKTISEAQVDENLKNELSTKILTIAQENKNLDFYFFKRRFQSGKINDIDVLITATAQN